MSAAEIIELIKKLPPAERAEVVAYLEKEVGTGGVEEPLPTAERSVRYISNEEFDKIAPKIFEENRELLRRLAQ